ncbi:uncharacterized protein L199_003587 [Kwoniella botswanensis]|uniref:uncharacterized protein n=1 Tax=Kwoniella botswanensis TaxID=1268659 RepID=UPI00315D8421
MPAIVISALSDPVAIVHIPISLSEVYTTKIYWTIDRSSVESAEFFNITSNRIEMAIFGSLDLITHEWSALSEREKGEILISTSWRVFEISSGDQDEVGNYDSPHLRHVSAPLAKAGISILYQSSYFTDFLLVKESDFENAKNIFNHQGWQIDPSSTPSPRRRSLISPLTPSQPSFPSSTSSSPARSTSSITPEITVLPSPLACIGFSKSTENTFSERIRKFLVWPERCYAARPLLNDNDDLERNADGDLLPRGKPFISYTKNEDGSSLVTEIEVLKNILTNDDGEEDGEEYGKSSELFRSDREELFFPDRDQDDQTEDEGEGYRSISDDSMSYLSSEGLSHQHTISRFNGQTFTPPPDTPTPYEYSLPPTPYDKRSFEILSNSHVEADHELDDGKSDYSVGEIPIKWSSGKEFTGTSTRNTSGNGNGSAGGRKRCLQLDLRGIGDYENEEKGAYHLHKSGLVTRFSELLSSSSSNGIRNGSRSQPIRMLYSSTFHTANILVEARDVKRAKRLLERKRRSVEWN